MEQTIKTQLDAANKLIFVRKYDEAEKILLSLLYQKNESDTKLAGSNMLVHLRLIELAGKLNKLEDIRKIYSESPEEHWPADICLAFLEQHSEERILQQSIDQFSALIKKHGPNAACFFGIGLAMEMQGHLDRAEFNYQEALKCDQEWFPAFFGLSQIYYQKNNDQLGDHYFFLFEKHAPYNVYGNFETHKKLSEEFLEQERFSEAELAVSTLKEWWEDNRGFCPIEIQIFEALALRKIIEREDHEDRFNLLTTQVKTLCEKALASPKSEEKVNYFIARLLEDYRVKDQAILFYEKVLDQAVKNPEYIQKIGGHFISQGEYDLAERLFSTAFVKHPDVPEIRFCLLVSRLKKTKLNTEEYLLGKERLKQLLQNPAERVEALAVLHSLLSKFQDDPDIHMYLGEIFTKLGHKDAAKDHFEKMYSLDPYSSASKLNYAAHLLNQKVFDEKVLNIAESILESSDTNTQAKTEARHLRAQFYIENSNLSQAEKDLAELIKIDPWNVSYAIDELICAMHKFTNNEYAEEDIDLTPLKDLNDSSDVAWDKFDKLTAKLDQDKMRGLIYLRVKLRYLFNHPEKALLLNLIKAGCMADPLRSTNELLKLLNTNFDSPFILYGLGKYAEEEWQHEIANYWYRQTLEHPLLDNELKGRVYLRQADLMNWAGVDLNRAVELAKIGLELVNGKSDDNPLLILAHAYLKAGQIRHARVILEQLNKLKDEESTYLEGLLHYRNGDIQTAKAIWKPLISSLTKTRRMHQVKQEVLKFYFDQAPYLKNVN